MQNEPTTTDILEAIHDFSASVDERFNRIEGDISGMKGEISGMKSEILGIKSVMVTKDYLDEKMAVLRGDLVGTIRKEDAKVDALVDTLHDRKGISAQERTVILSKGPFPRL